MNDLKHRIKTLIIDSLNLEDMTPGDIDDEAPLFGEGGLGLDSVDALELGLAIQNGFNFKMENNSAALREHFYSVNTLAQFIAGMTISKEG
ncbi:MAG: phosphopantetheine-binding protein [Lautropia sp.]|nr:phosphopantetheine-binding protein [Lautropia sp.]